MYMYADIDECAGNGGRGLCGTSARAIDCDNAVGSYNCTCQPGFDFDGTTCAG